MDRPWRRSPNGKEGFHVQLQPQDRLWSKQPFLFFTIVLLLKSYLAWMVVFDNGPSWTTVVKELPFVWIAFCLIEWFASKRKLFYYLTVNLLVTGILFAVIMYYKYYGVIVTYHALEQVNQVTAVKNSVFSLMDPYYLFIFMDIVILGYWLFRTRKTRKVSFQAPAAGGDKRRFVMPAIFAASLFLCLFHVLPNRASMNEITKAEQMGILNYEAYTLFANEKRELIDRSEISQQRINALKNVKAPAKPAYKGIASGRNVIVIQMESFQNFLIGLTIDGQEVTPNMNKLAREHFYFSNFYQQVGQGNTSDAEFVVNTSYYIPPQGAATQRYAGKELPSLPKLMKAKGYSTATFHTNVVEFWNRGELYAALGFDRYFDQQYFGDEDTVFFGASDEVLYRKTMDQLRDMQASGKPFYAHIISMTAHHPFTTPKEKDKITLPERYQDTFVGDYIRAQSYADYALGQFIDELKESGIWQNSLIVVYGDHQGLPLYSLDRDDEELMAEIYGREYSYTDMINVPLIIAAPGLTKPKEFEQLGGQVDVLPTIANLTGISLKNYIHFGQDLLNHDYNLLPQRYYLPTGSFMSSKALFMPGSGFEDGKEYPLAVESEERPLAGNGSQELGATEEEYARALKLLDLSDSYVSQLPDRNPEEKE
ncbi:LTA synthase family protein [Paenibacillus cisolokensis]|uniref:LTA synthase family protein n=1 Tax=Paenibacillus cisolokensis TaxID=1658519 RepID=UPI003D2B5CCF